MKLHTACILVFHVVQTYRVFSQVNPTIFIEPNKATVNENQSLSLYCNTTNIEAHGVTWTKNGRNLSRSNTLVIDRIGRDDGGQYICNASYDNTSYVTAEVEVKVRYPPDIIYVSSNKTVGNGSNSCVFCNATGYPAPDVSFHKDGSTPLAKTSYVELRFNPVLVKHAGWYTCKASNSLGNEAKRTYIDVQYPTNISIPATDLSIPAWLGKTIVQECKATGNPTPTVKWYRNNDVISNNQLLNITISAVSQFGVYTCRAENILKNLSRDIRLNRTRFPPGVTIIVNNVTSLSSQNFTLQWEAPDDRGSLIMHYIVWKQETFENSSKNIWESSTVSSSNRAMDYLLTWGKKYRFYVTAVNDQGKTDGTVNNFSVINEPIVKNRDVKEVYKVPVYEIVGGVVSSLVVIAIIVIVCYIRKRRSRGEKPSPCAKESHFNHSILLDELSSALSPMDSPKEYQRHSHHKLSSSSSHQGEASSEHAIYGNVSFVPDKSVEGWEIPRGNVRIEKIIGKGAFGQVAKAFVTGLGTVAVKMIKSGSKSSSNRENLLAEYNLLQHLGSHDNVIMVLGGVTLTNPVMVFFEYVPYGDLLGYLRRSRGLTDTYYFDPDIKPASSLTSKQLLKFAREIADGMAFISSKKIIHRDLAARNILVGQGETCKITDFGMARDVKGEDIYQKKRRGRLPVKWTAYEALLYGFYSTQSDVWSYAIVLYEIFTIGGSPYPNIKPRDIAEKIYQEYRMPKPKHLDDEIYALMDECWKTTPDQRPTFESISSTLRRLERHEKEYIHMNDYEVNLYANLDDL